MHCINLASGGRFRRTGQFETTPADVDAIVTAIGMTPSRNLVVHFHGGLVNEAHGLAVARSMQTLYEGAAYPVTFAWETGAFEIIRQKFSDIWSTKLFQLFARTALRHVGKKLGVSTGRGNGVAGLSDEEIDRILFEGGEAKTLTEGARGGAAQLSDEDLRTLEAELQAEIAEDFEQQREYVERSVAEAFESGPGRPRDDLMPIAPSGARGFSLWSVVVFAVEVAFRVVKRFVSKRDHGLYPTVAEEVLRAVYVADIGAWGWRNIQDSAAGMWANHDGDAADRLRGGRYFLERLGDLDPKPTIHLVGHSAGAIAICHLIKSLRSTGPSLAIQSVSLLAPACRHDLFRETIGAAVASKEIENFRMFTMEDELEQSDALIDGFPALYPRSLLYLVSGIFENDADTPILGMHRFLTGAAPFHGGDYKELRGFLSQQDRLVLSRTASTAPDGMRCHAIDHGAFDEDAKTRESLRHIASK